jgi:hypothetical protein
MGIKTYSAFVYGHTITDENKFINIDEGSGEISIEVEIGSFTLDGFVNAIAVAINSNPDVVNEYTATVNRSTRVITISSDANFDILVDTGTQSESSAFPLMGFTNGDLTGQQSYSGNEQSGSYFEPQLYLQKYIDFADNVKTTQANVNKTASGLVEVVSYGTVRYMECLITLQTNIEQAKESELKNDPSGYDNLRSFMLYCITKAPIEFIKDINTPDEYTDCLLERTDRSSDGVDFRLKELYSRGLVGYFDSGSLVFRELI